MKTLEARILLSGKDTSGQAFNSAAAQAERLQRRMESVARTMRAVGVGLTAGVTLPVLALGRASVQAFGAQQAAIEAVKTTLESMGPVAHRTFAQVVENAEQLEKTTIFSRTELLQMEAQLLRFGHIHGRTFDLATKAIVNYASHQRLIGKEVDLADITRKFGRALQDPVNGMQALRREGVKLNPIQEKWVKALMASNIAGAGQRAQLIILAELASQFGGKAAAAARTQMGQLARLHNEWERIKEDIGGILTGPLAGLIGVAHRALDAFKALPPPLQRMAVYGLLASAALGPLFFLVGSSITAFVRLAGWVWAGSRALIAMARAARGLVAVRAVAASSEFAMLRLRMAATGAQGAVMAVARPGLWATLTAGIGETAAAIGTLTVAALPWLAAAAAIAAIAFLIYRNWKPISAFFKELWGKIMTSAGMRALASSLRDLSGAFSALWDAVKQVFDVLSPLWRGLKQFIDDKFLDTLGINLKNIQPIADSVSLGLKAVATVIKGIAYEINIAAAAIRSAAAAAKAFTGQGDLSDVARAWKGQPPRHPERRPPSKRPGSGDVWNWREWFDFSGKNAPPPPRSLQDLIARGEGNYNAVNLGAAHGYRAAQRDLTRMTISGIMAAQQHREFNAAGRYQIVRDTMAQIVKRMGLTGKERFDPAMQDRMFQYLITAKRPAIGAYIAGKSDNLVAAMHAAALEWASVGDVMKGGQSHYGGPNRASIGLKELATMLKQERESYLQRLAAQRAAPVRVAANVAQRPAPVRVVVNATRAAQRVPAGAARASADRRPRGGAAELAAMLRRDRDVRPAKPEPAKVNIGKGEIHIRLRHDGTVSGVRHKAVPENIILSTGVDNTGRVAGAGS